MDILKRIAEHRAREENLMWRGTFAEYLQLVRKNPQIAQTAHSRVYNMIKSAGVEENEDGSRSYQFFSRRFSAWTVPLSDWWRSISTLPLVDSMCGNAFCS
jgi:predicted Ser/Thr protein kinase